EPVERAALPARVVTDERAHAGALPHQARDQVPADEPARARDQHRAPAQLGHQPFPGPRSGSSRPSDGWTSSQPSPLKAIWIDSPELRPIRFFILKSVLIP